MRELYAKKLTKRERDFVSKLIDDEKFGYRGLIIALSSEGYPVSTIWRKLGVHPDNVRKWIRRFNKFGIDGIAPKKRGRPRLDWIDLSKTCSGKLKIFQGSGLRRPEDASSVDQQTS
ncbi:MAG: helix-turn-helix domain-containing protein [Candidatus Hadarchaeales archaeon]